MSSARFVSLDYESLPAAVAQQRAAGFLAEMRRRRTVRDFSERAVPDGVVEDCVATAATSPSGANLQPWHFVVVRSAEVKRRVREAAEQEERAFYEHRAPRQWLEDLAPLGTGATKAFLEAAPCLIVVFCQLLRRDTQGVVRKNYYPLQSAAIATGLLIAAIHHAGLVCVPYTPSRMGFLNEILHRPREERPLMIVVAGYPGDGAQVPCVLRKPLEEVVSYL